MNPQEAEKTVSEKSNDELLAMLAHPENWQPDCSMRRELNSEREGSGLAPIHRLIDGTAAHPYT